MKLLGILFVLVGLLSVYVEYTMTCRILSGWESGLAPAGA